MKNQKNMKNRMEKNKQKTLYMKGKTMKKSKCYHLAQTVVVSSMNLPAEDKIEILKVLLCDEEIAEIAEQRKEASEAEQDDKF